jgi:hypothetical protein
MRTILLYLALLPSLTPFTAAQECFQIHGRAMEYRGDGFFAIWHIGTHHIFSPDADSTDLVCKYFDCESGDRQPALFADFTICPSERFVKGAAQLVKVTAVVHPYVIPDWPPQASPREFLKDFLAWYPRHARSGSSPSDWKKTTWLMHWDMNGQLAKLLEADATIEPPCKSAFPPDFDPLLNSTQSAEHYEVGTIQQHGGRYMAKIYRVTDGKRSDEPDVIADFAKQGQRWYFLNFEYPSSKNDLLSMLNTPRPACTPQP